MTDEKIRVLLDKISDNIGNLEGDTKIMNEILRDIRQALALLESCKKPKVNNKRSKGIEIPERKDGYTTGYTDEYGG